VCQTTTHQPRPLFARAILVRCVLAKFFETLVLQGHQNLPRMEPRPAFRAAFIDPAVAAVVPRRGFSIRWTGTLTPPVSGDYTISAAGGRVYFGDAEVGERPMALEAGRAYKLRVEYRNGRGAQGRGRGTVRLQWIPPAEALLSQAVQTVKNADVAVAFLGLNPNLEGEEMKVDIPGFSGGDRTDLNLPAPQEQLLEAAVQTGK